MAYARDQSRNEASWPDQTSLQSASLNSCPFNSYDLALNRGVWCDTSYPNAASKHVAAPKRGTSGDGSRARGRFLLDVHLRGALSLVPLIPELVGCLEDSKHVDCDLACKVEPSLGIQIRSTTHEPNVADTIAAMLNIVGNAVAVSRRWTSSLDSPVGLTAVFATLTSYRSQTLSSLLFPSAMFLSCSTIARM